jgi:hypothetical protein
MNLRSSRRRPILKIFQPKNEIPDVYWAKDIERIENQILREREIEAAKKMVKKRR